MKVNSAFNVAHTNNNTAKTSTFKGITQRMPEFIPSSLESVVSYWKLFANAKYYEALDDSKYPTNKIVRIQNYSFLDRIPDKYKKSFIEYFKEFTGFPNLPKTSSKITDEFKKNVKDSLDSTTEALIAGFDPACSVGLQRALPGADLDKAYVVINNNSLYRSDADVVAQYKGRLWHNTDQRIMSLNNPDTFPEVYTIKQLESTLDMYDEIMKEHPLTEAQFQYFKEKRLYDINPLTAGEFNIYFAWLLGLKRKSKEYAKNFAYFIESVRDGRLVLDTNYFAQGRIQNKMNNSVFCWISNVAQIGAHDRQINNGMKDIKTKLRNREELSQIFDTWSIEKQFELIKDIIKSVSRDESNKFEKYFKNDDDIKQRFERLNRLLV